MAQPRSRKLEARDREDNTSAPLKAGYLLGALALTLAGFYSLPNYQQLLPPDGFLARLLVHPSLLFLGFLGLFWVFRAKEGAAWPELDRKIAYSWFAFFFGLCFFVRFYKPEESSPFFWDDNLIVTGDIRNIVDFHICPLIFTISSRPPFFSYFTAFLWEIFPHASGIWIVRLSGTLIDLGIIWGLYRLGSVIRGRRLGLILMAFWAVSRIGMIWIYFGGGNTPAVLACVWVLFFSFRILRKPSMTNFLYWGAALAFGDYCYPIYRPWTLPIITLVLLWVLWGSRERLKGRAAWFLAAGVWFFWAILFFYKNNFLPHGPWSALITQTWFLGSVILALVLVYAKVWNSARNQAVDQKVLGWAAGAGFALVLMSPLLVHPLYSSYSSTISIFHQNGKLTMGWEFLKLFLDKFVFTLKAAFLATDLTETTHCWGHSFFDSFSELSMVIGLAYFLARPSWEKAAIFLMVPVGLIPFVLSIQDHTGRLLTAIAPLFLMGGMGLDALWGSIRRSTGGPTFRGALFLALLGLWAWDANWNFTLCRQWMAYKWKNDPILGAQVMADWQKYHVVIARHLPEFVEPPFFMLCDQKDAWLLNAPHPIYLEPGEKGKDVVLMVSGGDPATQERVRKDFPQAQWTDVPSLNGPRFMERILIPLADLPETPVKLLYVQKVPHEYWRRRFFLASRPYGIARGLIWLEDRVPTLQAPTPSFLDERTTAQFDGPVTVPISGDYRFEINQAKDVVKLWIDGKEILHEWPGRSGEEKIFLDAGVHRAAYQTAFRSSRDMTDVLVGPPNGGPAWMLGKSPLENKENKP